MIQLSTPIFESRSAAPTVLSLFSGAGGMDLGFIQAGCRIVHASDFDSVACETYRANIGAHTHHQDVSSLHGADLPYAEVLIGGPPCQGFSVAGHMRQDDHRSQLVWEFVRLVGECKPKVFVMENVKALAQLERFSHIRAQLMKRFSMLGYAVNMLLVNAADYGVPQRRERVLFIGVADGIVPISAINPREVSRVTVRDAIGMLPPPGIAPNLGICGAKVVLAAHPVLRRSPYAGMLFNGQGRPVALDATVNTLPASMGGNRTPIIDECELRNRAQPWVVGYHKGLLAGVSPGGPSPGFLRRLTVTEAALLQTFPSGFEFKGSQCAQYRQIGNAVPPKLSTAVASVVVEHLSGGSVGALNSSQQMMFA